MPVESLSKAKRRLRAIYAKNPQACVKLKRVGKNKAHVAKKPNCKRKK